MLSVHHLTKRYGDFLAVDAISFNVGPGEVLGLVGPNGAGKTTTLRSVSGIILPTSGEITVAGHDLLRNPRSAKHALAFVPDEPQLFEYLTVDEHLRFIARLYGVHDAAARMPALLERLELGDKAGLLPSELSRGMKQKLAIACALLHEPKLLLLDEPLTGLDPAAIRRMKDTIADHAKSGAAVVLSSHLLHLVEELCTRVLVIQHGKIVALGTMQEIIASRPELAGLDLEEVFMALTEKPAAP